MTNVLIIDYGMGNILSVANALASLGVKPAVSNRPQDIAAAERLILPGVGAFPEAMERIAALGIRSALDDAVLYSGKPVLGICLGMQILAGSSTEGRYCEGLGWIEGTVDRMDCSAGIRLPHVGWNEVHWREESPLAATVAPAAHFYFDHGYSLRCPDDVIVGVVQYGGPVVAAVRRGNIFGVQFHPEKSQNNGRRVLRAFVNHPAEGTADSKC